jgi:hypothetical protein
MNRHLAIFVIASIVICCKKEVIQSSISSQVSSNSVVQESFESNYHLEYVAFIPCSNEWVHAQGDVYISYHRIDRDGGFHLNTSISSRNFRGVGLTSGQPYRAVGNFNQTFNSSSDESGASTWHVTGRLAWITPGGKNNSVSIQHITVIRNANGKFVVDNQKDIIFSCR